MAHLAAEIEGVAGRVARVSFTGERSYELSVPSGRGVALWRRLLDLGQPFGILPYGLESLSLLRAEKGYLLVGTDTDGTTMPDDLGMSGPLKAKQVDFVGKRSLLTPEATRADRRQLVGLGSADAGVVLPVGAHIVERRDGAMRSLGWVTSSAMSPTLGRPIALAMIERGRALAEAGSTVEVFAVGRTMQAVVTPPCFYDPQGARLHG
jgi:sarcosine oxidase subunit alpha